MRSGRHMVRLRQRQLPDPTIAGCRRLETLLEIGRRYRWFRGGDHILRRRGDARVRRKVAQGLGWRDRTALLTIGARQIGKGARDYRVAVEASAGRGSWRRGRRGKRS